jgi:uncharacterized protein
VILIGGDCPWLTQEILLTLEQALDEVPVAVIPAEDGGYVALGMRECVSSLFEEMPWSESGLMERTRQVLRSTGLAWRELPVLPDVDEWEDWERARRAWFAA